MRKAGLFGPASKRLPVSALFHRGLEHLGDIFPVHQMIEKRFQIIRAAIAIVDVVGVFPDVAAQNWFTAVDERVLAVRRFHDGDFAFLDLRQWPDVGRKLFLQSSWKFVAASAFLHPLPEMNVVEVLGGIVEEARIFAEGALDDLFY